MRPARRRTCQKSGLRLLDRQVAPPIQEEGIGCRTRSASAHRRRVSRRIGRRQPPGGNASATSGEPGVIGRSVRAIVLRAGSRLSHAEHAGDTKSSSEARPGATTATGLPKASSPQRSASCAPISGPILVVRAPAGLDLRWSKPICRSIAAIMTAWSTIMAHSDT